MYPVLVAVGLVLVIGLHAVLTGVLDLWIAVRLRNQIRTEWLWGTAGVLSIVIGVTCSRSRARALPAPRGWYLRTPWGWDSCSSRSD